MSTFISEFLIGGSGKRVAIKDSIDIAGHATRSGSRAFADAAPATRNADVVDAILDAGWQIVGKTNMHELAFGVTGINDWTGTPINPQAPDRVPGGSSSGSAAAVAGGLADIAIGTDTGGSVRVPAACCGIAGLKPTYGRVSRVGAHPAESSLDCVGPFAADMADLIAAMQVICPGFQVQGLPSSNASVGFLEVDCDPHLQASLGAAADRAGWRRSTLRLSEFEAAFAAGLTVINFENWAAFGHLTGKGLIGADVEQRLLAASRTSAADLAQAEKVRERFSQQVDAALEQFAVLLLPTMPSLPPTLIEARSASKAVAGMTPLVRPFNLSGHPALTVPVELDCGGLKVGLQIVGRKDQDELVCAFGAQLQQSMAGERPTPKNKS
ncbi:amidase, Asp-tRNAAsn/Glu-tRNAGln amidotransferase A subunit [Pseudomonas sp. GM21]|jgi:amidase|uniref:amidase n=1 Tax=unclassified Pseudomonas TaxID=196821 RepID=UPI0002725945|nr:MULTISPECIES: amidase [unclassified Pseudomonas]EJM20407.1 amidase, Asp-tRNAAsn/Glu-tRNAGln amidotransferase A subunit [Pseudomonas sp. GM21]MDR6926611.1 amidase [Pseudomonas sp. BE134]